MKGEVTAPLHEADESSGGGQGRSGPTWIEELAGPDDYWLTLTDAARVTRRQEVTIRRWVAAGTLPVRNRPLGLNKRTRHVRASDLAQLSPIVDVSATISGATAQIDLLSIPAQQAEIIAQNQQVQQQLQSFASQLETESRERHHMDQNVQKIQKEVAGRFQQAEERHDAVGRQVTALKQTAQRLAGNVKEVQEEQKALRELREHEVEQLRAFDTAQSQHMARIESLEKRAERIETLEKRLVEGEKKRTAQQQRIDDLAAKLNTLIATVSKVEKTLAKAISERQRSEEAAVGRINQLERSLTRVGKELHQQSTVASQQLQALHRALEEADNRSQQVRDLVARQGRQIEEVTQQLRALAEVGQERAEESKVSRRRRGGAFSMKQALSADNATA